MREEMWGKQKQSPRLIPGRGDWIRACFMGESLPQADTRRRTEGTRGEAEEARSASLPSWHQTPARPCGGKRVCSGPTDRVYLGDGSPIDVVSDSFGQVACSIRSAPRVGPGRAPGSGELVVGDSPTCDPLHLTSGDGDSGTGLSVRAEDDGDRWGGIPRVHPLFLVRIESDQIGWGEITVWRGEVNG